MRPRVQFLGKLGAVVTLVLCADYRGSDGLYYREWISRGQAAKLLQAQASPATDANIHAIHYESGGSGMAYLEYFDV